jgi:hypothetical protein
MQKTYLKNGAIIIGFFLALAIYIDLDAWNIHNMPPSRQTELFIAAFWTFFGFFIYWLTKKIISRWLDPYFDKLFEEIKNVEQGEEGEDGICAELVRMLDKDNYTIHRNFRIPARKYDIDAIVVGPKGIME